MKRYEYYRETASPFLKEVPSHWEDTRIGRGYAEKSIGNNDGEQLLSVFLNRGVVSYTDTDMKQVHKPSEDMSSYQLVEPGDFVLNNQQAWRGSVGVSSYRGIVSPAYIVMTPIMDNNPRFMNYMLRETACTAQFVLASKGVGSIQRILSPIKLKSSIMVLPPRAEQDQIVRYLDWQVSKINRLISAKRKEVELYKEQMCKVFSVSSSENQKVRLKRVCDLVFQPVDIRPDAMYCKTGMYNRGRGIFRREPMLGCELGDSMFQHIDRNHVMISGQFAWEGAAYVTSEADEEGIVSHRYYLLKPTRLTPEYIWAYLMSDKGLLEMLICSHGSAGRNRPLNIEELLNTYIPLPNSEADEKRVISAVRALMYIYRQKERVFQLYEQLRTRLISDVVTGQVDVRSIEVPEYEYVAEADVTGEQDEEETEEEVDG